MSDLDALYEQIRRVAGGATTVASDATDATAVAPGIRALALRTPTLPPAAHTNAYLVGPERGTQLLFDPGSPYAEPRAILDRVLAADAAAGRPLAAVVLTHHHGDHVGGVPALVERGIPVWAHAATAELLAGIVPIARTIADGEALDAGGLAVTALSTPGHAAGHLCFEVAGAEAMIVGDMVASVGTILIDPSEGDMADYLRSLERMLARPAQTLLPAHGAPIRDGHGKLREYLVHRRSREQRVLVALERAGGARVTTADLVAEVYADTPRALWPLAERSLRAHTIKLAREGVIDARDDSCAMRRAAPSAL